MADTAEMERLSEAALTKFLAINPDSLSMQELRAQPVLKRGRSEDALLIVPGILAREPDRYAAKEGRVVALFKLGQARLALVAEPAMLKAGNHKGTQAIAAAVHFETGDDAAAIQIARKSWVQMTPAERADALNGVVALVLVLVAADPRAGRVDRAQAALKDFYAVEPQAQCIAQIKAWRLPHAVLPDSDGFWQALRRLLPPAWPVGPRQRRRHPGHARPTWARRQSARWGWRPAA